MNQLYRTDGLLDLDQVKKQKLVFIGLGSLGSLTLENLAYPWREIVLIDPDTLERDNVERHLLSNRYVGKPKVQGVKDWLIDRGVSGKKITIHHGNAQENLFKHTDANLVVVSVDNLKAKFFVDNWARANNLPLLVGGIYPLGTGGHTVVLPNPNQICYGCAAHTLGEDDYQGKKDDNYGIPIDELLDSEGNMHHVPALRTSVSTIAADIATWALRLLKGASVTAQIFYHAIEWETVLTLNTSGIDTQAVTGYISRHSSLGLTPHMSLKMADGRLRLNLYGGTMPVQLKKWANCPNHNGRSNNSISDI